MAKKQPRRAVRNWSEDLGARIDRAIHEQRFQNALELSRELHRQGPTPHSRQVLHTAALGRARQLREQGSTRDAVAILRTQIETPDLLDAMRIQIAEELARCGEATPALTLLGATADPQVLEQVLAVAADTAIQKQKAGRPLLPASLHADFDRILLAFEQVEAGQDEAVRQTLQAIGLRSPFLEWKVFLRGLQAYYQNDDARAVENWQRLKPERLPARLAAPLRFGFDRDFQVAQPPESQTLLQKQAAKLQGSEGLRLLRELQASAARAKSLGPVFRQAEQALQAIRREAPHLVKRLGTAFYWMVLAQGQPEDVPRYQRVFGSPTDDPHFHRLEALAWERSGEMTEAHKHWHALEKEIASRTEVWPGPQSNRARALIWQRMGRNASMVPDKEQLDLLPPFLRNHPDRPRELKPGAEECFRRCIELEPDQPDGYRDLFKHFVDKKKPAKAIAAGRDMLARFPDDVPMLTRLGEVLMGAQKYGDAVEAFQGALKYNPLDRTLRHNLGSAHLFNARTLAEKGRFDDARESYRVSLELDPSDPSSVLCKWAACEIKAGDAPRGEELLQQALAGMGSQLAVGYSMVIEAIRLKLPPAVKKRFDESFKQGLAAPPDPQAALLLADTTASHHLAGVEYHGQKTHQKKVLDYLKKAIPANFSEAQMEGVCAALLGLGSYRLTKQYLDRARELFDANPLFPLLEAENEIERGPGTFHPWTVKQQLGIAQKMAERLPPGPKRDGLLERIANHQKMLDALNPFGRMFDAFDDFDPFFGDEFDEEP